MIYIFTLIIVLFLVYHYDINGNTRNRMTAYYLLMFWYIAISGLQYRMGSDIKNYMVEFEYTDWSDIFFDYFSFFSKRQFGWELLVNSCKSIYDDFAVLKIVQAIILNFAVFKFLNKNCKMFFTAIFFYSIYIYLDLNFNIIRQSLAIAFFLFSYQYLLEKKWLKYYLFVFIALMFHNTALILFILPLFYLVKLNKRNVNIISVLLISTLVVLNFTNFSNNFQFYVLLLQPELLEQGNMYLENENYGSNTGYFLQFLFITSIYALINLFIFSKEKYANTLDIIMFFLYLLLLTLNSRIPIFARFNMYFMPFFIYFLSTFIHEYPNTFFERRLSKLITLIFIILFSYIPVKSLFKVNPVHGQTNIVQYYPYYTIFDKGESVDRENILN